MTRNDNIVSLAFASRNPQSAICIGAPDDSRFLAIFTPSAQSATNMRLGQLR
jgi:hypothetical protein